jgi:hypothetical protein
MVESERTQTIWRLRLSYWISKIHARKHTPVLVYPPTHPPTRTHAEIRNIYCSPRQQWLRKRASLLRYMYIVLLNLSLVLGRYYRREMKRL